MVFHFPIYFIQLLRIADDRDVKYQSPVVISSLSMYTLYSTQNLPFAVSPLLLANSKL